MSVAFGHIRGIVHVESERQELWNTPLVFKPLQYIADDVRAGLPVIVFYAVPRMQRA
jgi:hypothetical protein